MSNRLSPSQIESIARDVLAKVFAGTRAATAPITLDFDYPCSDPEHVSVEVHLPHRVPDEIDPSLTVRSIVEINERTQDLGDDRFFGITHRFGRLTSVAA
jgi:hypothetical protein